MTILSFDYSDIALYGGAPGKPVNKKSKKNDSVSSKENKEIDLTDEESELKLFDIYNYKRGIKRIVKTVLGPTKEKFEKTKVVNTNVKYAFYVLLEERELIKKIEKKYYNIWGKGMKENRDKEIGKIKKMTNWKLRVLNEQEKIEKDMLEAAETLVEFSKEAKKEAKKKKIVKKGETIEIKGPVRRSNRIAQKELEKRVLLQKKCWGCVENQPNQMAHIGLGGCLGEEEF